ncbi:DNA-binding protein [Orbaceae bacterium ac157xtp]
MIKEWYSSKELMEIEGLPSTIQGVNRKARAEQWRSRKRPGVQGKALEYHIDSLPSFAKSLLYAPDSSKKTYTVTDAEPIQTWISAFVALKQEEQQLVISWIIRNGLNDLLNFIKNQ